MFEQLNKDSNKSVEPSSMELNLIHKCYKSYRIRYNQENKMNLKDSKHSKQIISIQ